MAQDRWVTEARLRARALAWPLRAVGALTLPVDATVRDVAAATANAPRLGSDMPRIWSAAWRTADDRLGRPVSLLEFLHVHAFSLLEPAGPRMRLVPDHAHPGREILAWRWISLALPPSILLAARVERGGVPSDVEIHDPSIVPPGPLAHLHVHAGAAYGFELLWAHLAAKPQRLVRTASGLDLDRWVPRAMLARRILARHLAHDGPLRACARCRAEGHARAALRELQHGRLGASPASSEAVIRALAGRRRPCRLRDPDDVWRADPLFRGVTWPEGQFLADAFRRSQADPDFERLFVQLLRVKTGLYAHLVCDGTEAGLGTFTRFFRAIRDVRGNLEPLMCAIAAREAVGEALELRTAPPAGAKELGHLVRCLRRERRLRDAARRRLELGWVFHFVRDGSADGVGKRRVLAIRAMGPEDPDWRAIHAGHQRRARTLATRLRHDPGLLRDVRALDVAGEEKAGPLWLCVRAIRWLRDLSSDVLSERPVPGAHPLKLTLHVGEDFHHLLGGLRAIHEPFLWRLVRRGDRLGHALAVGLDANEWFERTPRVQQPRWERLLDLAWLVATATRWQVPADQASWARWSEERDALCQTVFGRIVDVGNLHEMLGDPALALRAGLPSRAPPAPLGDVERAVWALVYDRRTRKRAFEPVFVETALDRAVTVELSRRLRLLLSRWQTVIELNPSSNLVVGGLDGVLALPWFGLQPDHRDAQEAIPVCVSADDPLSFATSLLDEYAYAWAGLVEGGAAPGYARRWIDAATKVAWRARFTQREG